MLPSPLPTATPTPLPTTVAIAAAVEPTTTGADLAPDESIEFAANTVTIMITDDTSLLPYVIAALSLFSFFCIGMGVRSFTRNRRSLA